MGASNNNGMIGNLFSVVNGKWTKRVEAGTVGAIQRVNKKGNEVYELGFTTLSGHLISGNLEQSDFGWSAKVTLHDRADGNDYIVTLPIDSKYLMDIIKRLPVVDPAQEVILSLAASKKKVTKTGGPVFNLYMKQGQKNLEDQYVKWTTGSDGVHKATYMMGLPEPETDEITGQKDYKKQERWLLGKFKAFFETYEPAFPPIRLSESTVSDMDDNNHQEDDDGIPF